MWLETDRIHFIISGNCIRDFCEKSKMLAGATLAIGVIAPQVLQQQLMRMSKLGEYS